MLQYLGSWVLVQFLQHSWHHSHSKGSCPLRWTCLHWMEIQSFRWERSLGTFIFKRCEELMQFVIQTPIIPSTHPLQLVVSYYTQQGIVHQKWNVCSLSKNKKSLHECYHKSFWNTYESIENEGTSRVWNTNTQSSISPKNALNRKLNEISRTQCYWP